MNTIVTNNVAPNSATEFTPFFPLYLWLTNDKQALMTSTRVANQNILSV